MQPGKTAEVNKLESRMSEGIALITVFIIVFLLFALVGAFLYLATNARSLNERYHENLIALGLAEAGADFAIWEINFGGEDFSSADGWGGTNPKTISINNFQDADGNIYGDIDVWVYNPKTEEVTIISQGSFNSITGSTICRRIRVLLKKHFIFGRCGVLTVQNITMSGNGGTDSYDSSLGLYGGTNVGQNGDVETNGNGTPAISLSGNASIGGDANTGPGGTISKAGNAAIAGSEYHTADEYIPPVDVPDDLKILFSQGPLSLSSNDALPLTDVSYKYDSISLSGNSKLTLGGIVELYIVGGIQTSGNSQIIIEQNSKVSLYFDGNVSISGNGVWNKTTDPSQLSFFGTNTSASVSLSGNSDFYGTIYAPAANLSVTGNGDIYGALGANTLNITGNGDVHYDDYLKNDGPTIGYDPFIWQEK